MNIQDEDAWPGITCAALTCQGMAHPMILFTLLLASAIITIEIQRLLGWSTTAASSSSTAVPTTTTTTTTTCLMEAGLHVSMGHGPYSDSIGPQ